jgi:mono/diheme cytochrome c family protein
MRNLIKILAAGLPLMFAGFAFGDIAGSKHDFSAQSWSDNQICKPCHTPHNADVSITGRLWAHTMSTATYKSHGTRGTSTDGTTTTDGADATVTQSGMDSASRLCLSCHDGTVALDSFMGKDGGSTGKSIGDLADPGGLYNPNVGGAAVGAASADLSNDHPVGYAAHYDETTASAGHYRYKPLATVNGAGLKLAISPDAFPGGKVDQSGNPVTYTKYYAVSCITCHNVHNAGTGTAPDERGLLRMSNTSSSMCLTCHNK